MSSAIVGPYRDWLVEQAKLNDVFVLFITAAVLTYEYWSKIFTQKSHIPHEFWYQVPQATGVQAASRQKKSDERNISRLFTQQELDFVVFWGSQSGRAEILARQFAKSLQDRFGLRTLAADLDDFDHGYLAQLKEHHMCGFILSTYGDGDPPDNTNDFWNFLHTAGQGGSTLSSLCYVIFGLGNSNYRQYNHVAKTVDALLKNTGAARLGNIGFGDDAHGATENDFLSWRRQVQEQLKTSRGLTERKQVYQPAFEVDEDSNIAKEDIYYGQHSTHPGKADSKPPTATPVKKAYKLWETDQRLCIHMDLDLGHDRVLKYKTGDHLAVWPCNPEHEIDQLLKSTGLSTKRHGPVRISPTKNCAYGKVPIPTPTTIDSLFRHYLEICGHLSMDFVAALAEFAPSDDVRTELRRAGEDPDLFKATILAPRLTLGGLLEKLAPDVQWDIPISFLLERLKPMQTRYYSISSSAVVHPRSVSITAVVDKPINGKNTLRPACNCYGLATGYLWALERSTNKALSPDSAPTYALDGPGGTLSGGKLFCNTFQSSFKLPLKSSSPIIMVGAGTGVAPFRAFVQERMQRSELGQEVGRTLLFMGFRNSDTDFIYKEDWERWRQTLSPDVFQYQTAFSRDDESKKVYVQNLVETHGKEIMDLLELPGCRFYICGSASMARDVVAVLVSIRVHLTGCSQEEALVWVKELRQFKTLLEDVWG